MEVMRWLKSLKSWEVEEFEESTEVMIVMEEKLKS